MKPLLCTALCLLFGVVLQAQDQPSAAPPPYSPGGGAANAIPVLEEPPPPVVINGKRADKLTDDELLDFLQNKVQDVTQTDGEVVLLRVAPGYPLALFFDEPYQDVILGDEGMVSVKKTVRGLVLVATSRQGDTSMQVVMGAGRRYIYHVFIAKNFLEGMTSLRIRDGDDDGETSSSDTTGPGTSGGDGRLNIGYVVNVVENYDALKAEHALDDRAIRRQSVFRPSAKGPFTYYDWYQFSDHTVALTFSVANRSNQPVKIDESRLRLDIGQAEFIPDFVDLRTLYLPAGKETLGYCIFAPAAFSLKQHFELNWSAK